MASNKPLEFPSPQTLQDFYNDGSLLFENKLYKSFSELKEMIARGEEYLQYVKENKPDYINSDAYPKLEFKPVQDGTLLWSNQRKSPFYYHFSL